MDISVCQNAALIHVNQFWSMLDDMAQNNPDEYKTFIERHMQASANCFSPPAPNSCLRALVQVNNSEYGRSIKPLQRITSRMWSLYDPFLKPHDEVLYVNVCGWKRVPAPASPTQPVPLCGGKLETFSEREGTLFIWHVQNSNNLKKKKPKTLYNNGTWIIMH